MISEQLKTVKKHFQHILFPELLPCYSGHLTVFSLELHSATEIVPVKTVDSVSCA